MSEQRTPDELTVENQLICTKLLGWEFRPRFGNNPCGLFFPDGRVANGPYSFTTWGEAGLILDALQAMGGWESARVCSQFGWLLKTRELTPVAIRKAAVELIRSLS